jgi:hypothetical protein
VKEQNYFMWESLSGITISLYYIAGSTLAPAAALKSLHRIVDEDRGKHPRTNAGGLNPFRLLIPAETMSLLLHAEPAVAYG